ncbi:MAG: dCTP deaminase, partial [Deltaproteobacteria bacterium]|nr:dCTP deaminase [Deltaproteobacteria bacterium]
FEEVEELFEGADFVLSPGEFALGTTLERGYFPNDLDAHVEGRSSIGRLAVLVYATAGFIDPGFKGANTLELPNLGPTPASQRVGSRICPVVFHTLTSPVERPFAPTRGGKYSGQKGGRRVGSKLMFAESRSDGGRRHHCVQATSIRADMRVGRRRCSQRSALRRIASLFWHLAGTSCSRLFASSPRPQRLFCRSCPHQRRELLRSRVSAP